MLSTVQFQFQLNEPRILIFRSFGRTVCRNSKCRACSCCKKPRRTLLALGPMEDWFAGVGRRLLTEALSDACDQVNNDFKAAYARHNAGPALELAVLRRKASRVQELEEENEILKTEIVKLKSSNSRVPHHSNNASVPVKDCSALRTPLAPKSGNQAPASAPSSKSKRIDPATLSLAELKAEYLRIDSSKAKLQTAYLEMKAAFDESKQALRRQKELGRQWTQTAAELGEQSAKRQRRIKRLEAKLTELSHGSLSMSFSSDAGDDAGSTEFEATSANDQVYTRTDISGTKAIGAENALLDGTRRNEEAGTTPSLPPLPRHHMQAGAEIHIKPEPSSDGPLVVSERCIRKRRNDTENNAEMPPSMRLKLEDRSERQSIDEYFRFHPHESVDFDSEERIVRTPKKHSRFYDSNNLHAREIDTSGVRKSVTELRDGDSDEHDDGQYQNHIRSGNSPVLSSSRHGGHITGSEELDDHIRRKRRKLSQGISRLAQENNGGINLTPKSRTKNLGSGKLGRLLSRPEGTMGGEADTAPLRTGTPKSDVQDLAREPGRSSVKSRSTAVKRPEKPKAAPLRQTPMAQLRRDDFKINPDANEGYNYAFIDVVRNKAERACLSGCVKENCCGAKYRKLAEASRPSAGPHEFQSLLEEYLGDDCHRLATMPNDERERLWVKAKTRELSNASSTHRERYPRQATPPGFWRSDFPSTQEGEEYNEAAKGLERDIVEERYREAMRPGGTWIFRDE
ncbi:SAE2-domain-containing protein [Xylariaceae sp. FL1272]|nr:SAE2-domain-containing protein [Xylariaceae sp. FL1272]